MNNPDVLSSVSQWLVPLLRTLANIIWIVYTVAIVFGTNSNEYHQAMQQGNSLQHKANETARQFNELFRK